MSQKNDTIVNTYCDAPECLRKGGRKIVVNGPGHRRLETDVYILGFDAKSAPIKVHASKPGDFHPGCLAAILYAAVIDLAAPKAQEASGGGKA
jgi:hypothetical protein